MAHPQDDIYDLIIVGAGPAGSTAALYAMRRGLRTLLLDKHRFPRDKVCGDAVSGKAVTVLRELDLLEKAQQLPGVAIRTITFGSPDGTVVDVDLRRSRRQDFLTGFVVRRRVFDSFLFDEARAVVDTWVEGFTVRDLVWENGQVCGVSGVLGQDGSRLEYRGKIVLGADGFGSIVARRAGLYRHDPRHWIVALRWYYRGVKGLGDQIELHYIDKIKPGYFWIFPLEDGYANVGIGMLHANVKKRGLDLRAILRDTIRNDRFRHRFEGASPAESPVGWNLPVGSLHRKIHGNGFMLLGDAAGLIDPFTGEGIGNALFSARHAVECAGEACDAGDFGERFLGRYDRRLWGAIGEELKVSTRLQKIGCIRPLLNLVIRRAQESQEIRDLICGMIAEEIPKSRLTNPLFYLKLLLPWR
jgi:geranylgeranyl reductase family protein